MLLNLPAICLYIIGGSLALWTVYSIVPTVIVRIKNYRDRKLKTGEYLEENHIQITFDDGPDPNHTPNLLDLLAKEKVKATFYVVAQTAKKYPEIIRKMKEEGHNIGIHSFEHKNAFFKGPCYMKKDFEKSLKVMNSLGVKIESYRPPWGDLNLATLYYLKKNKIKLRLWDVMADDWKESVTAKDIENTLERKINLGGKIICLHDGRGKDQAPTRTIEALGEIIPKWKKQNFI